MTFSEGVVTTTAAARAINLRTPRTLGRKYRPDARWMLLARAPSAVVPRALAFVPVAR